MSRDFHLVCVTCAPDPTSAGPSATWGRWCDFNHQGDKLLALIPHLPLFARVAEAGFGIDGDSLDIYGSSREPIGEFARLHATHDVRVWDEYGEEWPQRLQARIIDRRLVERPGPDGVAMWPTPVDVLECGHEVEVERAALPRTDGYLGQRSCPVCVEPQD